MKMDETNFKTIEPMFFSETFMQLNESLVLKGISIISMNNVQENNFES